MTRRENESTKLREELGRAIVRLRAGRGLTQRQLAGKLHVDPSYLSRIERGQVSVPSDFVDRLIRALELTWDEGVLLSPLTSAPAYPDPGTLYAAMELVRLVSLGGLGGRVLRQMGVDVNEKRAIGRYLARGIDLCCRSSGLPTPVFLDSGSTCAYVAHAMALGSGGSNWQVFTNNILAALYLLETRDVFLVGGRVDREFAASMGSESLDQLEQLMEDLHAQAERWSPVVGVLSSLAFSAKEGPFARRVDPEVAGSDNPPISRHLLLKQVLVRSVQRLILVVTSEKLTRLEDEAVAWGDVLSPLTGPDKTGGWNARLGRPDALTHVILCLPGASTHRARHVLAAAAALRKRRSLRFVLVRTLFGEAGGATRLLTVIDEETSEPLSSEELEDRARSADTRNKAGT
jgi:transcriptional regulator with XRE-family HTH domain